MPLYTLIAIIAVLASFAFAQSVETRATPDAPLIRVSGEGLVEVAPDRVSLGLGVVAEGKTAVEAQQLASGAMTRVIGALQTIGVPPNSDVMVIQTSQISVSPRYDNRRRTGGDEPPAIIGYQASQRLNVRLDDVSKASTALDTATRAGANQNYGVTFSLQDSSPQQSEALARAVRDARARAEAIAAAAGGELGPVVLLTEPASDSGGFVGASPFMSARAAPAPPVEGGLLTVTARVEVTYALTPN